MVDFVESNPGSGGLNFLTPVGFKLIIDRLPNVTFFAQTCDIPELSMYTIDVTTPVLDYPVPGNKLIYSPMNVSFLVDENMENYIELVEWMYGINNPESLDNNRLYSEMLSYKQFNQKKSQFLNLFSDGYLHILDNNNNENITMQFVDMFPIKISSIKFSTTAHGVGYITCDTAFKFSHFNRIK